MRPSPTLLLDKLGETSCNIFNIYALTGGIFLLDIDFDYAITIIPTHSITIQMTLLVGNCENSGLSKNYRLIKHIISAIYSLCLEGCSNWCRDVLDIFIDLDLQSSFEIKSVVNIDTSTCK